jgi:WD40 repeat protein
VLGKLQALPTDAKPVVDRSWHTLDEALYDVAEGIRTVVVQLSQKPVSPSEVLPSQVSKGESADGSAAAWAKYASQLVNQASKRESADVSHTVRTPQPAKPLLSLKPEAVSLLRTLTGHERGVESVAFSPDGQTLASGSFDGTIKLWNLASGQELRTLKRQRELDEVRSVAFSPNGLNLASGSYKTIKLWNVTAGQEVRTLTGHTGDVNSVAFSPDGQTLASGGDDNTIKIWGKEMNRQ